MTKDIWTLTKLDLRASKWIYWLTGGIMAAIVVNTLVQTIITYGKENSDNELVSIVGYPLLALVLFAIIIPARHFRRIVNLGGTRSQYFRGAALTYVVLALAVSLANVILTYGLTNPLARTGWFQATINVVEVFGWLAHGPVVSFLQQFAFCLLLAAFLHTLTTMQDRWYGWVADILIIAIISVFTPIAPLRHALVWFFQLIIFNPYPWLQILACLVLGAVLFAASKPLITAKQI